MIAKAWSHIRPPTSNHLLLGKTNYIPQLIGENIFVIAFVANTLLYFKWK